jgi:predicted RNase H-like nuclease (RuvC/YqgF family)
MHQNPFTAGGYDYQDLARRIQQKADQHEIHSLRDDVDRLERSNRELSSEVDSLRRRCERLEESCADLLREWQETNGQFGVGA